MVRRRNLGRAGLCGLFLAALPACFGFRNALASESDAGPSTRKQCEFGMVFQAQGGNFTNVSGTVTVPDDWPEQQRVRVVKESLPPGATVAYKRTKDVGRQMTVRIPTLPAGDEVRAAVTFEVEQLRPPQAPQNVETFTAPERSAKLAIYLSPSPRIESDHPDVRKAAEEAVGDREKAWEQVKAVHQWVHQHITFHGGMENTQGVVKTLATRIGECAEKNSLAVAMLRSLGIPARLVRIPKHCYYEVYLVDGDGEGRWRSGDASAAPTIVPSRAALGIILQKGDSVPIIDPATKKRTKGRFLGETATGMPQTRGAALKFQPISPAIDARSVSSSR